MKGKSDKELAEEVEARRHLENIGWKREQCLTCNGMGMVERPERAGFQISARECLSCDGKGYHWRSPLT